LDENGNRFKELIQISTQSGFGQILMKMATGSKDLDKYQKMSSSLVISPCQGKIQF